MSADFGAQYLWFIFSGLKAKSPECARNNTGPISDFHIWYGMTN